MATDLTPKQIVDELNKYVVGQEAAKKAVAIAVRNRWRRLQLPKEMADSIIAKNILMILPKPTVVTGEPALKFI